MTRCISEIVILTIIASSASAETITLTPQEKHAIDQSNACNGALNACDEAIRKADALLKSKDAIIEIRAGQVRELAQQNSELQAQRDGLLHNPIFWFITGALVGGLSYGIIARTR